MWTCPKCDRDFKNTNQNHYCGEKHKSVEDYINAQSKDLHQILYRVRDIIRTIAPNAVEEIKWKVPTYNIGNKMVIFSANKNFLSILPGFLSSDIEKLSFASKLAKYKMTKGSVQFPYDNPIDFELITEIVKFRLGV